MKKLCDYNDHRVSTYSGMIFTYLWVFDQKSDWDYIDRLAEINKKQIGYLNFLHSNLTTL